MKAKLIVEGKEFEIDINHPELEKLIKQQKKTGYERVEADEFYFFENCEGEVNSSSDIHCLEDDASYRVANYYSNPLVAENNARADRLMRQLRRFAVEHRKEEIDWNNYDTPKYFFHYDYYAKKIRIEYEEFRRVEGVIYFDFEETAKLAIETFHDELIWYFTEYRDSL